MNELILSNLFAWSLQAALLTAVAALVSRLMHVDAPAVRYAWWRAVLVVCLALPLVQSWQQPGVMAPEHFLSDTGLSTRAQLPGPVPRADIAVPAAATPPGLWPLAITGVLVAGMTCRLAWLTAGLVRLRRLRRAGVSLDRSGAPEDVLTLIDAGAEIRYVAAVGQPVTFGVIRPVVLLPEAIRSMSPAVQRAVLAHELWHVRRRDWVWSLGEEVLRAVFWFHPAIWYLVSRVRDAREEVVDELAVLLTNARRSYLESLLIFADQPTLYPAAPFARRRQLFNRMLLISREAVMSSRRIVISSALMVAVLLLGGWYGTLAFPLTRAELGQPQTPARDPRPELAKPAGTRENELRRAVQADPSNAERWLELAKLQEQRGAVREAEATYAAAVEALRGQPTARGMLIESARFYVRQNQFELAMQGLERAAAADPTNPAGHQLVATHYWEKAFKDQALSPGEKQSYIQAGIAATDRALALDPDYVEALTYKNILLRMQGNLETDPARRKQLLAEADTLRSRAIALAKQRPPSTPASSGGLAAPPPPPPPPPPPQYYRVDGQDAVRVGGTIQAPRKLRHVNPVYPAEARAANVSGMVIVEALLDRDGFVTNARVLKSIPLLDEAALQAVRQWVFEPTQVDGVAVPLIMTVTVNFTLQ